MERKLPKVNALAAARMMRDAENPAGVPAAAARSQSPPYAPLQAFNLPSKTPLPPPELHLFLPVATRAR